MEEWTNQALAWVYDNREWLFSGGGITVLVAIWYVVSGRHRQLPIQAISVRPEKLETGPRQPDSDQGTSRPLLVHTKDGYLAQIGVLYSFELVNPLTVMRRLGTQAEAEAKIHSRLEFHLIEALEKRTIEEIRDMRAEISRDLLEATRDEMLSRGMRFTEIKIGRITPVDRHA